jgi:inner membrane protein
MGLKLMVVCLLALLTVIPSAFVESLVADRKARAADVVREISSHVGGPQTFLGPTLAIPYDKPPQTPKEVAQPGVYLVFPATASGSVKTTNEVRRRSLFNVPVFRADLNLDAAFDLTGVPAALPAGAVPDWSRSEIVVGVSDVRGAVADATLTIGDRTYTLVPAEIAPDLFIANSPHGGNNLRGGDNNPDARLLLLAAPAGAIAKPNAQFKVASTLRFSGAQRIAVLAYGKTTHLAASGSWPHPGFDGGFLPVSRSVNGNGFSAEWSVPFIARGVRAEGKTDSLQGLPATALGGLLH